jgi:hypothetical protein
MSRNMWVYHRVSIFLIYKFIISLAPLELCLSSFRARIYVPSTLIWRGLGDLTDYSEKNAI